MNPCHLHKRVRRSGADTNVVEPANSLQETMAQSGWATGGLL